MMNNLAEIIDSYPKDFLLEVWDHHKESSQTFSEWCQNLTIDGHPLSFKGREYLRDPYNCNHIYQVKQKATQVGGTVEEMGRAAYGLIFGGYRNVLYYFPSRTDVTDFSQGRIESFIEENKAVQKHITKTNRANLRQFGSGFLYLLGMRSTMAVKSIPAGMLIFDEFDEAPQANYDKAIERLGGVLEGEGNPPLIRMISNPSLPNYGVSYQFDQTDQRYWQLVCPSCGHYNCLEDMFMDWIDDNGPPPLLQMNGNVIRACGKCQSELDPAKGEWVAKRPSITDKIGWHYTQLWSQTIMHSPDRILAKYYRAIETGNLQDFFNLTIGIGYVEAENRLSKEEVLALCGGQGIISSSSQPSFMGIDQGKDLHVVIGRALPSRCAELIHIGVYKEWEELDSLVKNFNVIRCVVDALPEQRAARAFAERHKGKIWMHYYNHHQKGDYAWNERDLIVQTNRTESLDASHAAVRNQAVVIPKRCKITEEFADHMHNTAKRLEEEEEKDTKTGAKRKTGTKRYVYVKLGEDHFRHAFNYFCIAWQQSLKGIFGGVDV